MKSKFFTLLALMASTVAAAEEESGRILARMSAKLEAMAQYKIEFTVSAPDMGQSKGVCYVAGDKYNIKVDDQTQFSDGTVRYRINPADREVTLDRQNPDSRNLLENPTKAFDFSAGMFDSHKAESKGSAYEIELIPAEGVLDGINKVTLLVNKNTSLPEELRYRFDGTELIIRIVSVAKNSPSPSLFAFDRKSYSDYEIIDFR